MQITAKELAAFLSGEIIGDANVTVTQAGKIEFGKKGDICFLGNSKYEPFAYTTEASVLLVDKNFAPKQTIQPTLIRVADVYASVALLLEKFGEKKETLVSDISSRSSIHPSAKIGERAIVGDFTVVEANVLIGNDCTLHPQVYIGKNCSIGNHVTLHAGVKIYAGSILGNNIEIHANAVIGSDGFGFAPQPDGSYKKINHIGNVVIEDNVEIGANTTIDRGSIGATLIRKGVKLDNLIQIAHNVDIGEHTVIAAQTGVAGSTKIGKFNRIGGQVGIVGHIIIGDHVQIQAQSGVASDVPDNSKLYGSPAIEYRNYLKSYAIFKKAGKGTMNDER